MYSIKDLRDYQKEACLFALYNPDCMLWMQVGLGKTIVTLTTFLERKRQGQVNKMLVFGPITVVSSVWETEIKKWSHTQGLTCSLLTGPEDQRTRALVRDADIYLINYEKMNWLAEVLVKHYVNKGKDIPFQMVIYDEISFLQNSTSLRMYGGIRDRKKGEDIKKIKYIGWNEVLDKFKYRIGLTGTPSSNGHIDLHGQYLAVDGGKRLGKTITSYRNAYFTYNSYNYTYTCTKTGKQIIEDKISDITLKMDAKDYLDLPKLVEVNVRVNLDSKTKKEYDALESEFFLQLDNGVELEVDSSMSLSNKLRQFVNGAVYTDLLDRDKWEIVNDEKLKALDSIIKDCAGKPAICSYIFRHDAVRIMDRFKKLNPINLNQEPASNVSNIIEKWKQGKIKLLIGHPRRMGYGLDGLQEGGCNLIFFGLPWSYREYDQFIGRLVRSGQKNIVTIYKILCENTIDTVVDFGIKNKLQTSNELKSAIAMYRAHIMR